MENLKRKSLGPHLRTPNPGFNPEFTPAFVI
jgi:hypothetical protein